MVSAAVSVVFPWSTWPMVPMLTCGLVRSNFPLAARTTSSPARRPVPLEAAAAAVRRNRAGEENPTEEPRRGLEEEVEKTREVDAEAEAREAMAEAAEEGGAEEWGGVRIWGWIGESGEGFALAYLEERDKGRATD